MSKLNQNNPGVWALILATKDGLQRQATRENLVAMDRDATPVLLRLLENPDSRVRWEAALALKDLADPAAAEALVEALKDENGDVRWVAAEGLGAIGEASLRPLLKSIMNDAGSFELRDAAHVAIHFLRDKGQRELLEGVYRAIMERRSSAEVIMAAADAMDVLEKMKDTGV